MILGGFLTAEIAESAEDYPGIVYRRERWEREGSRESTILGDVSCKRTVNGLA